jgi:hypothetical protein
MKKTFALLLALAAAAVWAQTTLSKEVLVLTTATAIPRTQGTKAFEVQNLGPNPIYCAFGAAANAVVLKSRKIAAGENWSIEVGSTVKMWCITTVNQVTGAATVVTEAKQ